MNRLQYIKNNLHKTDEQLAKDLGIEEKYVVAIRKANGLDKYDSDWPNNADQWIERNFPTASWRKIEDKFPNKTRTQIKNRAYSKGVYRAVRSVN